jgi:hypothetical protein
VGVGAFILRPQTMALDGCLMGFPRIIPQGHDELGGNTGRKLSVGGTNASDDPGAGREPKLRIRKAWCEQKSDKRGV